MHQPDQHINTTVETHFYYRPFQALPSSINKIKETHFKATERKPFGKVIPSFEKIGLFEKEYFPKTKKK